LNDSSVAPAHTRREAELQIAGSVIGTLQTAIEAERTSRNTPMWESTHLLKSDEDFWILDSQQAIELVEKGLRIMYPEAKDVWRKAFPSCRDPRASLEKNWNVVVLPSGILERAFLLMDMFPFITDLNLSDDNLRFLSLVKTMDKLSNGHAFVIGQQRWGQVLGTTQQMISIYIELARRRGWLTRATEANREARLAATYQFHDPNPVTQTSNFSRTPLVTGFLGFIGKRKRESR
jgi:hypothetical protein